jgi:hypothetical protein
MSLVRFVSDCAKFVAFRGEHGCATLCRFGTAADLLLHFVRVSDAGRTYRMRGTSLAIRKEPRPRITTHGTVSKRGTTMTRGIKQGFVSTAIFAVVLGALVSVDDRVRERFSAVWSSGGQLTPWGDRVGDLGDALMSALRHQSIENAPLLIFTAVGAVLVVFMVKS